MWKQNREITPEAMTLQMHYLFVALFHLHDLCQDIRKKKLFILLFTHERFLVISGEIVHIVSFLDLSLWTVLFYCILLQDFAIAEILRVLRVLDSYFFSWIRHAHISRTVSANRIIYILCFVVLYGSDSEVILFCLALLTLFNNFLF